MEWVLKMICAILTIVNVIDPRFKRFISEVAKHKKQVKQLINKYVFFLGVYVWCAIDIFKHFILCNDRIIYPANKEVEGLLDVN